MRVSPSLIGLSFAAALTSAPAMAAEPLKADVIHWWTSGGESAAVKVSPTPMTRPAACGSTTRSPAATGGAHRGINRIVGGNPPTDAQFNTSKQFDDLSATAASPISTTPRPRETGRTFCRKRSSTHRCATAHFYALPVNIHVPNWFWYNTKVFADAGDPPSQDLDDVLAVGPKLKARRDPLRAWRPVLAGSYPVRRRSCRRRRLRPLPEGLRQGPAECDRESAASSMSPKSFKRCAI